jgi:selenocysteine lyase/cysteine desulfurase
VRPAPDEIPHSWETGTVNLEGIAGTAAAVGYLLSLGMETVAAYERGLGAQLLDGLRAIDGVTVYGTPDLDRRVPTATFNIARRTPAEVSAALGRRGIFVWDGNYYALELMQRLGLEDSGGAVRVGAVHYNTPAELDTFLTAVRELA